MTTRIVVVEDDAGIAELLAFTLNRAGYVPLVAESAERAVEYFDDELPQLAIIDWMLPVKSGLWLVERLRADTRTSRLPILMVSAMLEDNERIVGLEGTVDDYVAKPFSPRDLVARVGALVRCSAPEPAGSVIELGPLRLDPVSRVVTVEGRAVALGLLEFAMLRVLMARPNREFARSELRNWVWGEATAVSEVTVDVHMRWLRRALGAEGCAILLNSESGGYRLDSNAIDRDLEFSLSDGSA
jgi:two-component system, OmpR family, phosphate regulon response regulator PhoB